MGVIQPRLKEMALSEFYNSITILEQLHIMTSPGGMAEADGLQASARNPGMTQTPKEATDKMRDLGECAGKDAGYRRG